MDTELSSSAVIVVVASAMIALKYDRFYFTIYR